MSKLRLTVRFYDGLVADPSKLTQEWECHSWVVQYLQALKYIFSQVAVTSQIKDTGGTLRTTSFTNANLLGWITQGVSGAGYGPVVGTGVGVESSQDYCLGARILHGTGAGQLSHGATSLTESVVSGTTSYFKVARIFTNSSGGSITINEVGLYIFNGSYTFCIARDKLGAGEVCANLSSKTLEFTITVDNT